MKLLAVFLMNPTLSSDECTAHENVLCYHPPDVDLDTQMNETGFCTALMRLQERFGLPMTTEECQSQEDVSRSKRVRTITLAKKRYTIVPVEGGKCFVGVVTSRETLKPHLDSIPALSSQIQMSRQNSVDAMSSADTASSKGSPSSGAGAVPKRSPSFASATPSPHSGTASSAMWDNKSVIPHTNDEIDEQTVDIIERLATTSHKMFAMMFGSIMWNYKRLCVLENDEQAGARRRPKRAVSLEEMEYEEERAEQRNTLQRILREGFVNRLVSAIVAATGVTHCLEGSFACPEGIDILPVSTECHLNLSCLVSRLHGAHPGAIRDTFVACGMKTAYSTLSVEDTTTLYYLMKHYNSVYDASSPTAYPSNSSSPSPSVSNRQALRRSVHRREVAEEFADWDLCYSPENVLHTENRRSDFLRPSVSCLPAESSPAPSRPPLARAANDANPSPSSRAQHLDLAVSGNTAYGFPFIFLGDDDPVGVFTQDVGSFRFMFLVNEKYLRLRELRSAFEQSVSDCLQHSCIPGLLSKISTGGSASGSTGTVSSASQALRFSFFSGGSSMGGNGGDNSSLNGNRTSRQSAAIESEFLFYYRSSTISQVRSSILQRLPPCRGSLVSPVVLQHEPSSSVPASESSQSRRSTWMRHLTASFADHLEERVVSGDNMKRLSIDDRESIYLLDALRSDVLRCSSESLQFSCIRIRKKAWAFVLAYGTRDLSCVVLDRDNYPEAEARMETLARLVFFYSHRPPGL